jgi:hypothetical protein
MNSASESVCNIRAFGVYSMNNTEQRIGEMRQVKFELSAASFGTFSYPWFVPESSITMNSEKLEKALNVLK